MIDKLEMQRKFEETRCNPDESWISYCTDYRKKECPLTCNYATKLEKELGEWKEKLYPNKT